MKKLTKRIATLLLSLAAFAALFVVSDITAQAQPAVQKTMTVYLRAKATPTSATIEIHNLTEADTFDIGSVTSSKPGIVAIERVNTNSLTDKSFYYSYSEEFSDYYGSAWIEITCNKAGTSVISYKINDITYTTTVKVVKYTNAVKTFKLTGIGNGKNQASKYKIRSIAPYLLNKNIKNPVLTVAAKKNWKIKKIELTSYNGIGNKAYPVSFSTIDYNYGVSKAKLRLNPLKAKNSAELAVTMWNKKTNGSIVYYCYINYGGE